MIMLVSFLSCTRALKGPFRLSAIRRRQKDSKLRAEQTGKGYQTAFSLSSERVEKGEVEETLTKF
jgi:hypothetical protein